MSDEELRVQFETAALQNETAGALASNALTIQLPGCRAHANVARPVTLVNHSSGAHGFDFTEDSDTARHVIRSGLEFLQISLA